MMTVGVISLAVPLSTTFAGEFLILAGVFQQGWAWAVDRRRRDRARRDVHAARDLGRAAPGRRLGGAGLGARPARLGELAVVVPLVALPARASRRLAEPDRRHRRFGGLPCSATTTPAAAVDIERHSDARLDRGRAVTIR